MRLSTRDLAVLQGVKTGKPDPDLRIRDFLTLAALGLLLIDGQTKGAEGWAVSLSAAGRQSLLMDAARNTRQARPGEPA